MKRLINLLNELHEENKLLLRKNGAMEEEIECLSEENEQLRKENQELERKVKSMAKELCNCEEDYILEEYL